MRIRSCLLLLAGLFATNVFASSIQFQVTNLGGNTYAYQYFVSGISFQANEELEIDFSPDRYGVLSNAVAGNGFSVLLLQPDNPLGTDGYYSASALTATSILTGTFSVDFTFLGTGQPGSQSFSLNMYGHDANGNKVSTTLASGVTTAMAPEPASFGLAAGALLAGGALWTVRRRSKRTV